jgi:hypothetical protein
MATAGKWETAGNGSDRRKPLPCVATACRRDSMVRRGSTVRVRQRALQRRCKPGLSSPLILHFLQRAPGMEPIMELPGSRRRPSSPHASRPGPAADLRALFPSSEIGVKDDQRPRWRPLVVERPTCLRRDLSFYVSICGTKAERSVVSTRIVRNWSMSNGIRSCVRMRWTVGFPVACLSASS